jgi:hypothetical protein
VIPDLRNVLQGATQGILLDALWRRRDRLPAFLGRSASVNRSAAELDVLANCAGKRLAAVAKDLLTPSLSKAPYFA